MASAEKSFASVKKFTFYLTMLMAVDIMILTILTCIVA